MNQTVFADGKGNTPGCRCKPRCDFPCWQRQGIAEPCPDCQCPSDLFPPPDPEPELWQRVDGGRALFPGYSWMVWSRTDEARWFESEEEARAYFESFVSLSVPHSQPKGQA